MFSATSTRTLQRENTMRTATDRATQICHRRSRIHSAKTLMGMAFILSFGAQTCAVEAHDIYHSLQSPEGKRCCDETDCRPANYKITSSGVQMDVDDLWLPIPHNRIQFTLLAGDPGHTRGAHWCGWVVPDEGLHTHCAILPPSYAAATAIDAIVYDPDAPTAELRRTNVISKSGVVSVQQEFPLRTDK